MVVVAVVITTVAGMGSSYDFWNCRNSFYQKKQNPRAYSMTRTGFDIMLFLCI